MNQDEKMVLLIVQGSLIEGDASSARQKELAEMLELVISGGLTPRAADGQTVPVPNDEPDIQELIDDKIVDILARR